MFYMQETMITKILGWELGCLVDGTAMEPVYPKLYKEG